MLVVRAATLPRDAAAIAAIDTSFTTREVYDVDVSGDLIRLTLRDLESPLTKRFPLDDLDDETRPTITPGSPSTTRASSASPPVRSTPGTAGWSSGVCMSIRRSAGAASPAGFSGRFLITAPSVARATSGSRPVRSTRRASPPTAPWASH